MDPVDFAAVVEAVVPHPLPYFTLKLRVPGSWLDARPGQFVMVRVAVGTDPLLRRAFSIHHVTPAGDGARLELLIKVVGKGTARLAGLRPGDTVAVLGPLGRPFSVPDRGRLALVAGGVGSAPLYHLGRTLQANRLEFDVFYGGRSRVDLPELDRFAELMAASKGRIFTTTEDGSLGSRGLVTEALERAHNARPYSTMYACGPHPMLARLAALGRHLGLPGEAALETNMGCGFGACLGCAVRAEGQRLLLCCKDGPVFRFDEVAW